MTFIVRNQGAKMDVLENAVHVVIIVSGEISLAKTLRQVSAVWKIGFENGLTTLKGKFHVHFQIFPESSIKFSISSTFLEK